MFISKTIDESWSSEESYESFEDSESQESNEDVKETKAKRLIGLIRKNSTFLMISLAIHLVLILIISLLPGSRTPKEENVIVMTDFIEKIEEEEPIEEEEKIEVELEEVEVDIEIEEEEVVEEVEVEVETEIEYEEVAEEVTLFVESVDTVEALPSTLGIMSNSAVSKAPSGGLLGGRSNSGSRIRKGGARNEKVVGDALKWLAKQQKPNGTWPFNTHPNAINGAAALAFLGQGHSTAIGKHKDVVRKFVDYYIAKAGKNHRVGNHGHAQPFVLMAMCDAYAMDSTHEGLKKFCEGAVEYIIKTQTTDGGWSGGGNSVGKNTNEVDMAQTAWYVMALVSAKLAKLDVPDSVFKKVEDLILKIEKGSYKGKVICTSHGGQKSDFDRKYAIQSYISTILQFIGVSRKHPSVVRNSKYVLKHMPPLGKRNFWLNYNQGMGLFQLGRNNSQWKAFNQSVLSQIRKTSRKDASGLTFWSNSQLYKKGGGKSDTNAKTVYWGDCGATAMAILNLQVYYRYDYVENLKL